jgi:hypothetical protein
VGKLAREDRRLAGRLGIADRHAPGDHLDEQGDVGGGGAVCDVEQVLVVAQARQAGPHRVGRERGQRFEPVLLHRLEQRVLPSGRRPH